MPNRLTIGIMIGLVLGVLLTSTVVALRGGGGLDSSASPALTSSYTLNDIYNRLSAGTSGSQSTFTEPASGPTTTTMHTLNDIMVAAPAADAANAATAENCASGKTFWGLGTGGAWGQQTGTLDVTGTRATSTSFGGGPVSRILNGYNSDSNLADDPDIEAENIAVLLNPDSSDTLPSIIGTPSGYYYSSGSTIYAGDVPYPASISALIGTPTYDPATGLPLTASNTYNPTWVSYSVGGYQFTKLAPIALRIRSLRSQLDSSGVSSATGQRATVSSTAGISRVLDGANSDGNPTNGPDIESANLRQLLNPDSSDTLPNIIGVPSGYYYYDGLAVNNSNLPYPASISSILGTPWYDPDTGLPLTAVNNYNPFWVSYNPTGVFHYTFTTQAPIALRARALASEANMFIAQLAKPIQKP